MRHLSADKLITPPIREKLVTVMRGLPQAGIEPLLPANSSGWERMTRFLFNVTGVEISARSLKDYFTRIPITKDELMVITGEYARKLKLGHVKKYKYLRYQVENFLNLERAEAEKRAAEKKKKGSKLDPFKEEIFRAIEAQMKAHGRPCWENVLRSIRGQYPAEFQRSDLISVSANTIKHFYQKNAGEDDEQKI